MKNKSNIINSSSTDILINVEKKKMRYYYIRHKIKFIISEKGIPSSSKIFRHYNACSACVEE